MLQRAWVEQQGRLGDLDLARRAAARSVRHHHLAPAQHMQETASLLGVEVGDPAEWPGMKQVRTHPKAVEHPGQPIQGPC